MARVMVISFVAVTIACGRQSERLQQGQIVQQRVSPAHDAEERCVDGVAGAFARIDHHGEPMGFNVDESVINPSHSAHWQSIARHPYAGNFFYLTKNGVKGKFQFDSEAGLAVVRLGSDESTLARRSNLHRVGRDFEDSAPPTLPARRVP